MENRRNPTFQYFGGSAAKPVEWAIPETRGAAVARPGGLHLSIDLVGLAGIVMSVVMAALMLAAVVRYDDAARQRDAAQEQVAELVQEQQELRGIYEAGFDPEQIRQEAARMGMVPVDQAKTVPMEAPAVRQELTFRQWLEDFFAGLFA